MPKEGYVVVTLKRDAYEALKAVSREWRVGTSEAIMRLAQYRDIGERLSRIEEKLEKIEEKLDRLLEKP